MVEAPVLPLLLRMSGPAVFSMLIMSLYNVVDSLFVSAVSEEALRAVSIIFPVNTLMIAFAVGTSTGVNSFVARRLGAEDRETAILAARHGIVLSFVNWLVFVVAGYFSAPALMHLFTANPSVYADGVSYMRIVTVASLGLFWQIHSEKIFQATGNMTRAMYMQSMGALLNIVMDPILIFGWFGLPAMGVRGAAVATVAAQLIAGAVSVYLLLRREEVLDMRMTGFRFDRTVLRSIYRVGFPSMVTMTVMGIVGMIFNTIIKPFSEVAITVFGVYMKLESFVFMPVFGIGQGMLPLMGYNYGAKRYDRVRSVLKNGLILVTAIMGIATVIFQFFPNLLLAPFQATEEMYRMGIPAFRTISLCFVFAGITIALTNAFNALGKGTHSLFISIFRQVFILLPVAFFFAKWHLDYIWYAYAISDLGAMLMAIVLYIRLSRQLLPAEEGVQALRELA
mgnify:CR=1 FL=1